MKQSNKNWIFGVVFLITYAAIIWNLHIINADWIDIVLSNLALCMGATGMYVLVVGSIWDNE